MLSRILIQGYATRLDDPAAATSLQLLRHYFLSSWSELSCRFRPTDTVVVAALKMATQHLSGIHLSAPSGVPGGGT